MKDFTLFVISFLLVILIVPYGSAMQYCKTNDDCAELGGLKCIKSACEWGYCGCPRGQVSRYLGSEQLFQCVQLKKVDESCSNHTEEGVCGAENSICDDGTCKCKVGYMNRFGGEMCMMNDDLYASETYAGEQTDCKSPTSPGVPVSFLTQIPVTCHCPQGQRTALWNDFSAGQPFQGKKIPRCVNIMIGDNCVIDHDCKNIAGGGGAICKANKCVCKDEKMVGDVMGSRCGEPLAFGANCSGPTVKPGFVCAGSKGLICGDLCDVNSATAMYKQCACSPSHVKSGTTCTKRDIGSECSGDLNCKGINWNAICLDGTCQNGGISLAISLTLVIASLLGSTL